MQHKIFFKKHLKYQNLDVTCIPFPTKKNNTNIIYENKLQFIKQKKRA